MNPDSPLRVSSKRRSGELRRTFRYGRWSPQKPAHAGLRRVPVQQQRDGIVRIVPQIDRCGLVCIKSSKPETARDELRRTWLGEIHCIVLSRELDGVWRASAIREQCPGLGKVLGCIRVKTGIPGLRMESDRPETPPVDLWPW